MEEGLIDYKSWRQWMTTKITVFSRHNRSDVQMNPQKIRQHAENRCNLEPDKKNSNMERGGRQEV